VFMAHPAKLRVIAESSQKTDRNDSFHLANLLRMEYLPCSYVPEEEWEEVRNICRYRVSLGHKIARVKNEAHALLARNDVRLKRSDIFGAAGLRELEHLEVKDMEKFLLASYLKELDMLTDQASEVQQRIAFYAEKNEQAKLLMTIPGIDYYSAMTILGEIGDVTRFPLAKKLARYAGLTPRMRNTGKSKKEGRISKEGSKVLRWILVSAVHSILRCRKGNNRLKNFYLKLIRRKKSKKLAVVATAKLSIIYAMLTKGEEYKEGDDGLAFRKLRRMEATAVSVSLISKDISESLKMNLGRLRKKVDILRGGYVIK